MPRSLGDHASTISPRLDVSKNSRPHLGQVVDYHPHLSALNRAVLAVSFPMSTLGVCSFHLRITTSYQRQDCSEIRHISIQVAGFCPSTAQTWSGLQCSVSGVFLSSKQDLSNQSPCLWRIVEALTAGCLHTHALVLTPGVNNSGLQAQGSVQGSNILEAQRL